MIAIRDATAADDERLASLLEAQMAEHGLPALPAGIRRALSLGRARGAWQLVAQQREQASQPGPPEHSERREHPEQPAGVLCANEFVSWEKGGLGLFVEELYVAPHARRRGVARALLTEARRRAVERGFVVMALQRQHSQEAVRGLYVSMGFHVLDRDTLELDLPFPPSPSRVSG